MKRRVGSGLPFELKTGWDGGVFKEEQGRVTREDGGNPGENSKCPFEGESGQQCQMLLRLQVK